MSIPIRTSLLAILCLCRLPGATAPDHPLYFEERSPGVFATRAAGQSITIHADSIALDGVTLKSADMVVMPPLHGLDATIFPEPLRVDLDRRAARHCAWGDGVHRCPGSNLAEAEMAIMLEEWLARIPEFELDPDEHVCMQGGVLGTLISCRLRWDPATTRSVA